MTSTNNKDMKFKLSEIEFPIEKGDEILVGKFRNRKATITGFDKDENNQPIVKTTKGDKKLPFRISKLMKKNESKIIPYNKIY